LLVHDLREATISLLRRPGAPILALAVLSFGIGANSAIFNLTDAVLFRSLPVESPNRLVRLFAASSAQGRDPGRVSATFLSDYRDVSSFSCLEMWSDRVPVDVLRHGGSSKRLKAAVVSPGFFRCLGVKPAIGRLLDLDDQDSGAPVVLSHRLWQRDLDADPAALGTVVQINREPFVVVGVTPPGFEGIGLETLADVWLPLSQLTTATPAWRDQTRFRSSTFFHAVGRLAPGVDLHSTRVELKTIAARLGSGRPSRAWPEAEDPDWREPWPWIEPAGSVAGRNARALARLLAAVGSLVLALAGADVAGLMLVRGQGRRRELAVRAALGASRWRLVRPLVFEALLLSAGGCLGGLLVAHVVTRVFVVSAPPDIGLPVAAASSVLAPRVLAAAAALAAATTLLAGVWPAVLVARLDPLIGLQSHPPSGTPRWLSMRGALIALQVGVATVLLIGVGALLRSLWTAARIEPGGDTAHVFLADLDLARAGYDKAQGASFAVRLEEALSTTPGASAAALSTGAPLDGGPTTTVTINRRPEPVTFVMITPGYFEALGIRLVQGRRIEWADGPQAAPVAVVNRAFVQRFWPEAEAIGRHIGAFTPRNASLDVVGVVADARTHGLREPVRPVMYVPLVQFYEAFPWQFGLTAIVRTLGASGLGTGLLESSVHVVDPMLPVLHPRSLEAALAGPFGQQRLLAGLLGAFAGLALLLASAGLFGVLSLATTARTREFGVRIAVGALPKDLHRLVHARSLALCGLGLVGGLLVALAGHRVMDPFLFGVSSIDPLAFAAGPIVVLLASFVAAEGPARRAGAVEPAHALRHE
jgi:predicted permease